MNSFMRNTKQNELEYLKKERDRINCRITELEEELRRDTYKDIKPYTYNSIDNKREPWEKPTVMFNA